MPISLKLCCAAGKDLRLVKQRDVSGFEAAIPCGRRFVEVLTRRIAKQELGYPNRSRVKPMPSGEQQHEPKKKNPSLSF